MTEQAKTVSRTMTGTAAIAAVAIFVAGPAAYFAVSYEYVIGALETQASVSAHSATQLVLANPDLWRFEQVRLQELLERPSSGGVPEARRILDLRGNVVAATPGALPDPVVARRRPIYDAGAVVATVEVSRSLRPILLETSVALVVAGAIAAVVFGALRVVPLRAIRRAYASLEESEARYRSLYDAMHDGVALHRVVHDERSGAISTALVDVNPTCARIFGAQPGELLGKDVAALLGGALVPHVPAMVEVVRTGRPATFEVSPPRGTATFRVTAFSPQPGHVATIIEDVTERLRLQQQLAESRKLESIGRLAGGVAHDLNNLLSPILGYSDVLLAETPAGSPRAEEIAEVRRAAERARDLTRQLLALGRKQVLELRVLDVRDLVRDLERLLRRTLGPAVRLDLSLPRSLPRVRADGPQLEQVLMNLALNAAHAMPEGGVLTVELSEITPDATLIAGWPDMSPAPHVVLTVSDTGHGMERHVLERVFEPFFTTKPQGEGTGLGLSIVHGIVKQHGGQISVASEPGRGTTFRVYLPAVDAATEPAQAPPPAPARSAMPGGAETIAVAEDDAAVRRLAKHLLERLGYEVVATESAAECLALLTRDGARVDLLLTDVVMPGMTGVDLYARLSAVRPGLKVLFMSGHPGEAVAQDGALETGVHFIQKPFTASALANAVRQALDG